MPDQPSDGIAKDPTAAEFKAPDNTEILEEDQRRAQIVNNWRDQQRKVGFIGSQEDLTNEYTNS